MARSETLRLQSRTDRHDQSRRWLSPPAIVLAGYGVLTALVAGTDVSLVRASLAVVLALLGNGWSIVTVLFPEPKSADVAERIALAACLSLATVGPMGFALALSPSGLTADFAIAGAAIINLVCWCIVWRQRGRETVGPLPGWRWLRRASLTAWRQESVLSRLLTLVLVLFVLGAGYMLVQAAVAPSIDPPMTEFYLLDENGLIEGFPTTVTVGEVLSIAYGIANRGTGGATYQVYAALGIDVVGYSEPVAVEPDEITEARLDIVLPEVAEEPVKVEFILLRDGVREVVLHLWLANDKDG